MTTASSLTYRIDIFSDNARSHGAQTCSTAGSVDSVYDLPEAFGADLAHALLSFLPHPEDAYAAYSAFNATMSGYLSEVADFDNCVNSSSEVAE